jgi:hypothetical protein
VADNIIFKEFLLAFKPQLASKYQDLHRLLGNVIDYYEKIKE